MAHLRLPGLELGSIDAVLFDKDGTLSHSEPMLEALASARIAQCLRLAALAPSEPARHRQLQDLLERAYGFSSAGMRPAGITAVATRSHNLIATATAFTQVGFDWPDALEISERAFTLTDHLHGQDSHLPPQPTQGLTALLERLHASGVRCAVISNDHEAGIRAFLCGHGLERFFQGLWSAEHLPCKPSPGAVIGLCELLGVAPERSVLIGDANSDLRMARSAGVAAAIGFTTGWRQQVALDPGFPQLGHWQQLQVRL